MSAGRLSQVRNNWVRISVVILSIHLLIGLLELLSLFSCSRIAGACWAFFFVEIVDFPISPVVDALVHHASESWSFAHYWALNLTALVAYVILGSAWWACVVLGVRALWAFMKRKMT